jgi:hypothetical protein
VPVGKRSLYAWGRGAFAGFPKAVRGYRRALGKTPTTWGIAFRFCVFARALLQHVDQNRSELDASTDWNPVSSEIHSDADFGFLNGFDLVRCSNTSLNCRGER